MLYGTLRSQIPVSNNIRASSGQLMSFLQGGTLQFSSIDRRLPRFPYTRRRLTQRGLSRCQWSLLPKERDGGASGMFVA
jgi:hypothetical protein